MSKHALRVLLIDDENSLREPLARRLRKVYGYYVDTATTGAEALICVDQGLGQYDVALIDNWLVPKAGHDPEPLGIQLMREIKARYPHIECILFTAWGMDSGLAALRAGAYRYIRKPFDPEELAIMIEHAAEYQRLKGEAREKQVLEQLMATSGALLSGQTVEEVLHTVLRAVQALGLDRVRLYLLSADGLSFKGRAQVGMDTAFVGIDRSVAADRYMQALLADPRPQIFTRVASEPVPYEKQLGKEDVNQWVCAPLLFRGKVIGKLAADNKVSHRPIAEAELGPVALFAAQAAAAIENARLLEGTQAATQQVTQYARNLAAIQEVSRAISSLVDYQAILQAACKAVVDLFGVSHSGLVRFGPDQKKGLVVAEYPDWGAIGTEILVQDVPAEEQLVIAQAPIVVVDVANALTLGSVREILTDLHICSILVVPVVSKNRVLASFSLDMRDQQRNFTTEEIELCKIFAAQVAVALENAQLFAEVKHHADQLQEQKDYRERLVASSPAGVIAIDSKGMVTSFNEQAQKILKYQLQEVIGKAVYQLYTDPEEPYRIGELLYQSQTGKLADYETFVRSKEGESIPICLTATWLYDAQRRQIGSVGYFEDLRAIRASEQRLDLLLKASNTVAQAENLTDGLQHLAELLVTFLDVPFAGIELLDESGEYLVVEAAFPFSRARLDRNTRIGDQTAVKDWIGLSDFLAQSEPFILRLEEEHHASRLLDIARQHQLPQAIQSMLFIPLRTGQRTLGLLFLGELRPWNQAPLSQAKVDLTTAMADQTSVLIDRIRLHERTERRRQFLAALDESSRHIRAEKEPTKLLQEVVRLAAELVGCTAGGLYINHPRIGEVELQVTYGLPETFTDVARGQLADLSRQVARTNQPEILNQPAVPTVGSEMQAFHVLAGVPLRHDGETEAVLFVTDWAVKRSFTQLDLEVLARFAAQAAIALQTSRLIGQEQRALAKLAILHKISDYIQSAVDLDKILHVVLTGVTAGYGLGFNRAAMFLFDDRRENLIGRMGIGHLVEREARQDWAYDHQSDVYDFKCYLKLLEQDALLPTPIDARIRNLCLPLSSVTPDVFSQVVLQRRYRRVQPVDFANLPIQFNEAFESALPLIVLPLIARDQVIGLLVADNKFTRNPITNADAESLLTFANTAAIAINNAQLFHDITIARERLRAFYKASNKLVSSQNPNRVLKDIVEQARLTAEAERASVILLDEIGEIRDLVVAGAKQPLNITELIRADGYSMRVMNTSQPVVIEDTSKQAGINPSQFWIGIAAGFCLPIFLKGKPIGVMWFHYYKSRPISDLDIEAAQLYANQAALAYDSARRMAELEHMHRAAEALAGADGLSEVLHQIGQSAQAVLQADSAVVWSYDAAGDRFILEESVVIGILPGVWKDVQKTGPRHGGTAYTVMKEGWIGVKDISNTQLYEFLGDSTRKLLQHAGARSFQGVALTAEGENLGVLYVNYNRPRSFSDDEQKIAQTLANHAALALKKAKLHEQLNKARAAAHAVAEVTVLENFQGTLDAIVKRTREALSCDLVTLYTYDWEQKKFGFPPVMAGVTNLEKVLALGKVLEDSAPHKILLFNDLYVATNTMADKLMQGAFANQEGIVSSVGVPLITKDRKVGVMFVNYRNPHHFTDDELANIKLFAYQAAVAIRNAQLYEGVQKQAGFLKALYQAGRAVTGSLDLDEILYQIAEQAAHLTGYEDKRVGFALIALLEGTKSSYVASYPRAALHQVHENLGKEIDLTIGSGEEGRIGIIGRAIKTEMPQLSNDVTKDPSYLPAYIETRSELAVPIKVSGKVIGAINVEHPEYSAFDQEHERAVAALAAQAAIAIQNARRYQELKQARALVDARTTLALMGMANNIWRHSVEKHALTIREQIQLLRTTSDKTNALVEDVRANERLTMIEQLARKISQKSITPPLSSEEGVGSLVINDLVQERTKQLWRNDPYKGTEHRLDLQLPHTATVWGSREWLRRSFDILVDNAVDAVAGRNIREIVIGTRTGNGGAEIFVADTGPGLPENVRENMGLALIEKPEDAKGLGMGLLMAQAIVQTYGGEIHADLTKSVGTTMIIWLPLEK